jgi:hypothetical protein
LGIGFGSIPQWGWNRNWNPDFSEPYQDPADGYPSNGRSIECRSNWALGGLGNATFIHSEFPEKDRKNEK